MKDYTKKRNAKLRRLLILDK